MTEQALGGGVKPFAVERWFARYEFTAPYNIAESCAAPLTVGELMQLHDEASLDDLKAFRLSYTESHGALALRREIAGLYDDTSPEQVFVTVGGQEALFLAFSSLVGPGDNIVVEFPAYQEMYSVAEAAGAEVRPWRLQLAGDGKGGRRFLPDIDELPHLVASRTKLVVVNHPHNPTGFVPNRAFMERVVAAARAVGAQVLSDEVYRGLEHVATDLPPGRAFGDDVIVVGSMSKAYGLPGLRIGWLVADAEVLERVALRRDYTTICANILAEEMAAVALRARRAILARNRGIAARNLRLVREFMARHQDAIEWIEPQGGVVAFPRLLASGLGSEDFCRELVEKKGVLLVPGSCFEVEGHFRLGFGYDTDKLEAGLERFDAFLAER